MDVVWNLNSSRWARITVLFLILSSVGYSCSANSGSVPGAGGWEMQALPPVLVEANMPFYTPSISAIEHPHRVPDSTRTIVCLSCGDTMKHLRTLPRRGVRPEKLIFVCPSCKGVDTKELNGTSQ
jgi:hypothetical protein